MAIASAQDPRAKVQHQLLRKNKTTRKLTALDGKRRVTKWQKGPNLERMQVAVKRVRVNGESISHVALRTGLPERTLRRYVDLSKNTKRKDNPIFFRPLGPHEKLPKHLREGKALHAAGDGNYLSLVTNSSKGTTDNAICNTMKSKGMPYKRRYSEDGRKICRCGSATHKNTLHHSCPLNKKRGRSAQPQETQAASKPRQSPPESATNGDFSDGALKSCLYIMGDRMKLLVSIAMAQKTKMQKQTSKEKNSSTTSHPRSSKVSANTSINDKRTGRQDDHNITKTVYNSELQPGKTSKVSEDLVEQSAVAVLTDLTSESGSSLRQKSADTPVSISRPNRVCNAAHPSTSTVQKDTKEHWKLAPLPDAPAELTHK